jgi:uncharacterized membrane protein
LKNKNSIWILFAIIAFVVAARLPFLLSGVLGGDAAYHARAAVAVLNGDLLYRDVPYTYPPLYAYTEALSIALLGDTSIGWKAVAQVYDIGSIILIYSIVSRSFGQKKGLISAALYGFSPLPLLATSSFACFDSTAAFWMLASILLLLRNKNILSAVALGIGTGYKYFPILLLPPLLTHLSGKRDRIAYFVTSTATVALVQLPFVLSDFSAWFENVILHHVNRPASGFTVYNLLTLHPQLLETPQNPLLILFPISLLLTFLLVTINGDESRLGLFKKMGLVMLVAVFFNKVVLFYALWFIPLLCTFIVVQRKKNFILTLIPYFILQATLLLGWYYYEVSMTTQNAIAMGYVYLSASGLLLLWLLRDRLVSTINSNRVWKKRLSSR